MLASINSITISNRSISSSTQDLKIVECFSVRDYRATFVTCFTMNIGSNNALCAKFSENNNCN